MRQPRLRQAEKAELVSLSYLTKLFRRTEQTIRTWRRDFGSPYTPIRGAGRKSYCYPRAEVMAWANETGRRFHIVEA